VQERKETTQTWDYDKEAPGDCTSTNYIFTLPNPLISAKLWDYPTCAWDGGNQPLSKDRGRILWPSPKHIQGLTVSSSLADIDGETTAEFASIAKEFFFR